MHPSASIRRLALAGVGATTLAVVSGGLVGATAAASACPGWPLCIDQLAAGGGPLAWLAVGHRLIVAGAALIALIAALLVWRQPALERAVRLPLLLAPLFLFAQSLFGGLWLLAGNQALADLTHLSGALIVLGVQALPLAALREPLAPTARAGGRATREARRLSGLAWWSAAAGAIAVVALSARAIPPSGVLSAGLPANAGNALALAGGLAGLTLIQTIRLRRADRLLVGLAAAVVALIGLQALTLLLTPEQAGLSLVGGAGLVIAAVFLAGLSARRPLPAAALPTAALPAAPSLLSDYISLTKPKVISLLLVTTLAAMYITEAGMPSLWLVVWTLIGGYLAAGGAGAINCAFDSDIDINMGRTSRRPVPSGRIPRSHAMAFGLTLSALSIVVLLAFTTPLAAFFAALGIVYYALFYTRWLKRSTWQNIVIGGGAGAIPPLVGWTAVTGTLSPAAVLLFAIIFYWTPPHFWALALVKQHDYARAGVPMLPVVAGVEETRWQIMVYSVLMVALSLLLTAMGAMGWIYLAGAVVCGAIFLHSAWGVWRRGGQAEIWGLYKYSLLYLALLFAIMVADRLIL
jgi:protoheme IX farnesyltransferase